MIRLDVDYICKCAQIASVLEVSGHPKPGNVHRTCDLKDMCFEDFIISGVVIGPSMRIAAQKSFECKDKDLSNIGLGSIIKEAVQETNRWVKTNTNLGIVMMLTPLAAAAGLGLDFSDLRHNAHKIIESSTPKDAVALYEAINIADAGGMGKKDELDVSDESAKNKLLDDNINMFQVLKMSSSWDYLAYELTNRFPATFDVGYPVFKNIRAEQDINSATVQTFLTILAQIPDTLIQRKYGEELARQVSLSAKGILEEGGILTQKGRELLLYFEKELLSKNLNPGTTADLTAASIMVAYLEFYKEYHDK